MKISKLNLRQLFAKGLKPTQDTFYNLFDSFWHKDELIDLEAVKDLKTTLDNKLDSSVEETLLTAFNDAVSTTVSGIKGEAFPNSSPTLYDPVTYPNGLFEKWDVKTAGTYVNFISSTSAPIVVTTADLDSKFVQISVTNGVAKKNTTAIPGVTVAPKFDSSNSTKAQGGEQIYKWLFGDTGNIQLGDTTALTRADMNTAFSPNTTITYWMYGYVVPYPRAILSEFQINVVAAGDLYIKRYKKTGTGSAAVLTFQEQYVYALVAGLNTINVLTQPDKSGVIHSLWEWDSGDVPALFCSSGLKYTEVASTFNGLWGNGAAPNNDVGNFTVSQLSSAGGGLLLGFKFTEIVSAPFDGQVVDEIKTANAKFIPSVKAVMAYSKVNTQKKLTDIILIPSYGQSLSIGTDGGATTFTSPVDLAFTINNVNSNVQDMNGGYVETFKEMAMQHNFVLPNGFKIMTCLGGEGGKSITQLSKGSTYYTTLINNIQTAKNMAESLGKSFSVPILCWTQGEEDYRAGGVASQYNTGIYIPTEYSNKLITLLDDLNVDIKAITGQVDDVKMVMYQVASHNPYGRYPRIAIEQLKAAILDKRIILAKTMYDVEYNPADNVHAPNKTYRNMGNHYGISIFDAIINDNHRLPIYPVKSQIVGNILYLQFHVPVKPLQFDETWVSPLADGKKGFNLVTVMNEYTTAATIASSPTTITNVEIISSDTVKITMSGVPVTGTRLTYGVNGTGSDVINGNTSTGIRRSGRTEGARGNLRDSQTYFNPVSNYFNLYNWTPIFEIIF